MTPKQYESFLHSHKEKFPREIHESECKEGTLLYGYVRNNPGSKTMVHIYKKDGLIQEVYYTIEHDEVTLLRHESRESTPLKHLEECNYFGDRSSFDFLQLVKHKTGDKLDFKSFASADGGRVLFNTQKAKWDKINKPITYEFDEERDILLYSDAGFHAYTFEELNILDPDHNIA